MSILRKATRRGWTAVPNSTIRDVDLSYRATGVLAVLLSHSDGYDFTSESLARDRPGKEGRDAVRAAFKELRSRGYMKLTKYRTRTGRIVSTIDVSDHPIGSWIHLDPEQVIRLDGEEIPALEDPETESPGTPFQAPVGQASARRAPVRQAPSYKNQKKTPLTPQGGDARLPIDDLPDVDDHPVTDDVQAVWDAWLASTGKNRSVLSKDRRRRIRAALKDYPVDDVVAAVRGWKDSPHNRGENERGQVYNDIALLLRDAEHIERFRDLHLAAARKAKSGKGRVVPDETYR